MTTVWQGPKRPLSWFRASPLTPAPPSTPTVIGPHPLPGLGGRGDHDGVADGQGEKEVSDVGAGGEGGLGRSGVWQGLQPQGSISHLGQQVFIWSHIFFLGKKGSGEGLS